MLRDKIARYSKTRGEEDEDGGEVGWVKRWFPCKRLWWSRRVKCCATYQKISFRVI